MDKYDDSVAITRKCRCGTVRPLRDMAFADMPIGPAYLCDECAVGWELAHYLDARDQERHVLELQESNKFTELNYELCDDVEEIGACTRYPSLTKAIYYYSMQHLGLEETPHSGHAPELGVWADVWNAVFNS